MATLIVVIYQAAERPFLAGFCLLRIWFERLSYTQSGSTNKVHKNMNWDAIGVIAELIGATAVVVTLIFLIVEVRQNRLAAESASVDLLSSGWNTINNQIVADPDLAHMFMKGCSEPDTLTQAEWDRFFFIIQSYVNHFMTIKKHYDAGHLPDEEWEFHSIGTSHIANSPGGKRVCAMAAITPSVRAVFAKHDGFDPSEDYFSVLRDREIDAPSRSL